MHIPTDYQIDDPLIRDAFIRQYPFAQLVCATDTFPIINHLPFIYDSDNQCLWGHLAKKKPDLEHLHQAKVTVVFSGPHGYISPDWYQQSGVPTWNYQAVHAIGTCQRDCSESTIQKVVDNLSALHQKKLGLDWVNDYNPAMLSALVAIKIDIQEMHCQFKLSQDRSDIDRQNVIQALEKNGQLELAKSMKQALNL